MTKRMFVIFDTIRGLNAYDEQGNKLGEIKGGTKDPYSDDKEWNECNALVCLANKETIGEKEIPMREIYFDNKEVELKIFNLSSKINSLQKEIEVESKKIMKKLLERDVAYFKCIQEMMETFVVPKVIN